MSMSSGRESKAASIESFRKSEIFQLSEFLLAFNHLYQACSGHKLVEVPVDTCQLSGSRKICISFGILKDETGKTEN